MAFLKVVFDKLDPRFIETVLYKYKMSVEGALDELLTAEEERAKREQELMYVTWRSSNSTQTPSRT